MNRLTRNGMARFVLLSMVFVLFPGVSMAKATPPWEQFGKMVAADGAKKGDKFGYSVAISGNRVVIGARDDDDRGFSAGLAYIFDAITNKQLFELHEADSRISHHFGESVAISGNMAVIGVPNGDAIVTNSGSAYVFDTNTGQQLHKLFASDGAFIDNFGFSVAVSGNLAVIGSYLDDDNGENSGSAYVFDITTGEQLYKLHALDARKFGFFGISIAASGNLAVIGASNDIGNGVGSGSAYVFDISTGKQLFKLTPSDGLVGDSFGWSVAISGTHAVIGVKEHRPGAAYVFDITTGQELFKLITPKGVDAHKFGYSVALSGNTAVVGALMSEDNGPDSGSAFVFDVMTGRTISRLLASDGTQQDHFGYSVAIDGDRAVVGAPYENNKTNNIHFGSAYVFQTRTTNYLTVEPFPLLAGKNGTFIIVQALFNEPTWLVYSLDGLGQTFIPQLNITINLKKPKIAAGPRLTDGNGDLQLLLPIPNFPNPINVWFQVVQHNNVTNFFRTQIVP